MAHVVFVAPLFLENTNRYVAAFTRLSGVRLSVISQDPADRIPVELRPLIAGHFRVRDIGSGRELSDAVRALGRGIAPVDRLTASLEQLQLPLAEARERADVPGMRPEIARRFRDKDVMKEVLRRQGVPVAASRLVASMEELREFVSDVGLPIIVKPQAGLGSRGTHRVESMDDLEALVRIGLEPTASRPLQAEQFIRAREFTCETVTIHGRPVWRSGTRYFPTPLEVIENAWMQYCVLLPREEEHPWTEFAPVNGAALDALFGPEPVVTGTAMTHMEWFLAEGNRMFVSEVGARPPGVNIMPLMSLAHDVDMVRKWAELIALDRFEPVPRRWAAGTAFFRGQGKGRHVVEVRGLESIRERVGEDLIELRAPQVGQARASGYEGEGYALVRSATTDGAKKALLALIETVQVRYG